jgi:uncharacterized protein YdaT
MIDKTKKEEHAIDIAGQVAGEYIDSLGKTDLALFSQEEYATFIEAVVTAYQEYVQVPF